MCLYFCYLSKRMKYHDAALKITFSWIIIHLKLFRGTSRNSENKMDTFFFVQKPCLRAKYLETNIEENIDLKNPYKIEHLKDPISIREAASKNFVDTLFSDPSLMKNTGQFDFNGKIFD